MLLDGRDNSIIQIDFGGRSGDREPLLKLRVVGENQQVATAEIKMVILLEALKELYEKQRFVEST